MSYRNTVSHKEAGRERAMVAARKKAARLEAMHELAEEHALRVELGQPVDTDPPMSTRDSRFQAVHRPSGQAWTPRWLK